MRRFAPALLLVLLLASGPSGCSDVDGRMLFLRSGDAYLPILVQGSPSSSTLVLFVHGGPGGSGLAYASAMPDAFRPISERHLMAFYDQRGAGSSQGDVSPDELTVAQHVQDLDDVIALLRSEYPDVGSVFLLGHSWGGALTAAYLLEPSRAAGISGWIDVDGSTDFPRTIELSRAWAMDEARAQIADGGPDAAEWREALLWYEAHPTLGADELPTHFEHVDALGGTVHDPSKLRDDPLGALFSSPYSAMAEVHNLPLTQAAMIDELLRFDLHPELPGIRLPTLFLHGVHDGRVPPQVAREARALLGTPEADKPLLLFERSGHRPFLEEPEAFAGAVLGFVDRYR